MAETETQQGITDQARRFWDEMSWGRRLTMVGLTIGTLGLMAMMILQARTSNYRTLHDNLEPEAAAQIVEHLRGTNVPYQLSNDSRTVRVPADRVADLRIELAGLGLAGTGSVGFEIFDDSTLGWTDFIQQQNRIRALQGELTRTIREMSAVETARVHITLPEDAVFLSEQSDPSASVVVRLRPGSRFTDAMVQGITLTVARAVPNLSADAVAVIDAASGRSMTPEAEDPLVAMNNARERHRRGYELQRQEAIISMLEPLVGQGNVIARVAAEFDFSEQTTEQLALSRPQAMEVEHTVELSTDEGGMPAGVIGSDSELGEEVISTVAQQSGTLVESTITRSQAGETRTTNMVPGGRLVRQTASVALHHRRIVTPPADEESDPTVSYEPWAEDELAYFQDLVKSAMGFQDTREGSDLGDQVSVVNVAFVSPGGEEFDDTAYETIAQRQWILAMARMGLFVLGALVLFFFVLRPVTKQVMRPLQLPSEEIPQALLGSRVGDLEERLALAGAKPGAALPPGADADGGAEGAPHAEIEAPPAPDRDVNQTIRGLTERNPTEAAQVIKSWLGESA